MKKILLLIFFSLTSLYIFSQKEYKLNNEEKEILGTWIATSGNKSYEITFEKHLLYLPPIKTNIEAAVGSIKYLKDNVLVKKIDVNGYESPLIVHHMDLNKFKLHYWEKDNNGKEIFGIVYFDINADGKTARWYNLFKRAILESTKDTFDIPKELTFTKKPATKSQDSDKVMPHFEFP